MAFTRNAKPIMNFIKNETLGRSIGDNGQESDSFGGGGATSRW